MTTISAFGLLLFVESLSKGVDLSGTPRIHSQKRASRLPAGGVGRRWTVWDV